MPDNRVFVLTYEKQFVYVMKIWAQLLLKKICLQRAFEFLSFKNSIYKEKMWNIHKLKEQKLAVKK